MANATKAIVVKNSVEDIPQSALDAMAGTLTGLANESAAFQRRILLGGVNATSAYLAATGDLKLSREKLFTAVIGRMGDTGVSLATLRRWGTVVDVHNYFGVTASEGSASTVYKLTESGMADAKRAVLAIDPVEVNSADELVDTVVATVNALAAIEAAKPTVETSDDEGIDGGETADDVTGAPLSVGAFRESVETLLSQVSEDDRVEALKALRAIAQAGLKVNA